MFAGLWELWRPSEEAEWLKTFTIVTGPPAGITLGGRLSYRRFHRISMDGPERDWTKNRRKPLVELGLPACDGVVGQALGGYAIAILDLGLPQLDGLSVLHRWRAAGRAFPVLILSARGDWTEKVEGIESGADDYLAKPFEMGELIVRVRALVRRASGLASPVLVCGRLALDTRRMAVALDGKPLRLSPLEFRFLDYLAHHHDRAVPAGELAEHLYGVSDSSDTNAIEALVTRLRRKCGAEMIETRRGYGYPGSPVIRCEPGAVKAGSLRLRLLLGAGIAIFAALAIAWLAMFLLFERHIERRAASELTQDAIKIAPT